MSNHDREPSFLPQEPKEEGSKRPPPSSTEMASALVAGQDVETSSNRYIPLLCSVCPNAPRFSDVSHLLTHIASKSHLHHETQTKLKAHQDLASSVALQQYERWYSQYGIEALLVERMRTKQLKEAARSRRSLLPSTSFTAKHGNMKKRRSQQNGTDASVKLENNETATDSPDFPSTYSSYDETEVTKEYIGGIGSLSLKGQVWPGMGKMDLANEEMKRTRNQRKPKSVIDKMRRTSEGIEPTEVVLTPGFEVERVKDVYDDRSSPMPGEDGSPPPRPKITKPKRKKSEALEDLPVNVPKRRKPSIRGAKSRLTKRGETNPSEENERPSLQPASKPYFDPKQDVFCDDGESSRLLGSRPALQTPQDEQRFDLRDRMVMHQPNPISLSDLPPPTPTPRAPSRPFGTRLNNRTRAQPGPMLDALIRKQAIYALKDATVFNNSSRLPYDTTQYGDFGPEYFRLAPSNNLPGRHDSRPNSATEESVRTVNESQFMNVPGANPLLSQDHLFLHNFSQSSASLAPTSLAFPSLNRMREHTHAASEMGLSPLDTDGSTQFGDKTSTDSPDIKEVNVDSTWNIHANNRDINHQGHLNPRDLQL